MKLKIGQTLEANTEEMKKAGLIHNTGFAIFLGYTKDNSLKILRLGRKTPVSYHSSFWKPYLPKKRYTSNEKLEKIVKLTVDCNYKNIDFKDYFFKICEILESELKVIYKSK